jgi:hypothetical protein
MYENGKMRPIENIPGMEGRRDEGEWWREQIQVQYCKNFCKCSMYHHPAQQLKKNSQ